MHRTLIDPATLAAHLDDSAWTVIDTRFDLADPAKGEQQYLEGHIPGARYAHLDRDLSGTKTGVNGRHPLPTPEEMRARFGALGIGHREIKEIGEIHKTKGISPISPNSLFSSSQVAVYDAGNGMYAARLWWMLRYMGHEAVAVLDGGLARWVREGYPVRGGRETAPPATFEGEPRREWRLGVEDVAAGLGDPSRVLVDARAETRFRGEGETLDKVAGHIPGARNFFFQRNLTPDQTFKPRAELGAEWQALLGGTDASRVVMYCGSGVTACHNLLAMEHAGLSGARIFPGSWSEWSADPSRPIETGEGRQATSSPESSSKPPDRG